MQNVPHPPHPTDALVLSLALQWKASGFTSAAFLTGDSLHNVTILGPGVIEGNGAGWWNITHDDRHYRPHMIHLYNVTDLTIDGVEFRNSPK